VNALDRRLTKLNKETAASPETYEKDVDNQKGKGKKQSEKPEKTVVKWKPMHMDIAEKRALSCSEIMNSGR
jgi:hypothetical protein